MNRLFSICYILGIFSISSVSLAQMGLEGISSGRYEVRKARSRAPASDDVQIRTVEVKVDTEKKIPTPPQTSSSVVSASTADKPVSESPEPQEPTIGEQAESLFSSKAERIYGFYREQIHPDDNRNNRVELDILPVVAYNDSQSNFSYRVYQSYFNGMQFKTNVWFTPLIGVSGKIMFSLAADVDSMATDRSRIAAKYELVDLGVNFRKYFDFSRKSSSLEFSLLYGENKMTTPTDNTSRARLKSQGLGVGMKARMPSSFSYAWVFGGSFFPRILHTEGQTGIDLRSGATGESIRIGLDVGGEWKFTRESQMVWSLGVSAERNIFNGAASLVDPSTSLTPSNVGVTNSLYMFALGYRWGH